ncbi:MAG TPA: PQQ-binding-like beta-propeller repeat protein [Trebonia sp.]|nr:PQQ-binding-like beta-propeller repeat protein [Trebonia sp.]
MTFKYSTRAIGPSVAGLASLLLLAACGGSTPLSETGQHVAVKAFSAPATVPGTPAWTPWPSELHDARHSGSATVAGPATGKIRWRRELAGGVTQGAVVAADGTIYIASDAGILHALDPSTGKDRWTYNAHATTKTDLSVSPLVLPDGIILYPTPTARLDALSPSGRLLWTQSLPAKPTSPVTVNGKRVYVGDDSGAVSAIDVLPDGGHKLAWTVRTGAESYASVVTNGAGRVYTTSGSSLVAIDDHGATADIAWRADPHDGQVEVSPGLAPDGTVVLGTNGSSEWGYRQDGTLAWHTGSRAITYSSPAVTQSGLAYVADHKSRVHVYEVRTGTEVATYQIGPHVTQIWSSTVVDKDYRVYFAGQNGHVYGVSSAGAVLFDVNLGAPVDAYPALTAAGMLIIGASNGTLVAIGS